MRNLYFIMDYVFNATINNISVVYDSQFYWWMKHEYMYEPIRAINIL